MEPRAPSLEGLKVLVVEDDYYLAMDCAESLRQAGAEIIGPTGKHAEAIALINARGPDCALLDINLGQGACFDVAFAMREHGAPFAFLTGYDADVIPAEYAAADRLEKPVSHGKLVEAVERMAGRQG